MGLICKCQDLFEGEYGLDGVDAQITAWVCFRCKPRDIDGGET